MAAAASDIAVAVAGAAAAGKIGEVLALLPSGGAVEEDREPRADNVAERLRSVAEARAGRLAEARLHFRPGPRRTQQQRYQRLVAFGESLSRGRAEAAAILRSLAFRGWALAVAEAARTVSDLSTPSGGDLQVLRRARYVRVLRCIDRYFAKWHLSALVQICTLLWRWWCFAEKAPDDGRPAYIPPRSAPTRQVVKMCGVFLAWQQVVAAQQGSAASVAARMHSRRRLRLDGTIWHSNLLLHARFVLDAFALWRAALAGRIPDSPQFGRRGERQAHDAVLRSLQTQNAWMQHRHTASLDRLWRLQNAASQARLLRRLVTVWAYRGRAVRRAYQLGQLRGGAVTQALVVQALRLWKLRTRVQRMTMIAQRRAGEMSFQKYVKLDMLNVFSSWDRMVKDIQRNDLMERRKALEARNEVNSRGKRFAFLKLMKHQDMSLMATSLLNWRGIVAQKKLIRAKFAEKNRWLTGSITAQCFKVWTRDVAYEKQRRCSKEMRSNLLFSISAALQHRHTGATQRYVFDLWERMLHVQTLERVVATEQKLQTQVRQLMHAGDKIAKDVQTQALLLVVVGTWHLYSVITAFRQQLDMARSWLACLEEFTVLASKKMRRTAEVPWTLFSWYKWRNWVADKRTFKRLDFLASHNPAGITTSMMAVANPTLAKITVFASWRAFSQEVRRRSLAYSRRSKIKWDAMQHMVMAWWNAVAHNFVSFRLVKEGLMSIHADTVKLADTACYFRAWHLDFSRTRQAQLKVSRKKFCTMMSGTMAVLDHSDSRALERISFLQWRILTSSDKDAKRIRTYFQYRVDSSNEHLLIGGRLLVEVKDRAKLWNCVTAWYVQMAVMKRLRGAAQQRSLHSWERILSTESTVLLSCTLYLWCYIALEDSNGALRFWRSLQRTHRNRNQANIWRDRSNRIHRDYNHRQLRIDDVLQKRGGVVAVAAADAHAWLSKEVDVESSALREHISWWRRQTVLWREHGRFEKAQRDMEAASLLLVSDHGSMMLQKVFVSWVEAVHRIHDSKMKSKSRDDVVRALATGEDFEERRAQAMLSEMIFLEWWRETSKSVRLSFLRRHNEHAANALAAATHLLNLHADMEAYSLALECMFNWHRTMRERWENQLCRDIKAKEMKNWSGTAAAFLTGVCDQALLPLYYNAWVRAALISGAQALASAKRNATTIASRLRQCADNTVGRLFELITELRLAWCIEQWAARAEICRDERGLQSSRYQNFKAVERMVNRSCLAHCFETWLIARVTQRFENTVDELGRELDRERKEVAQSHRMHCVSFLASHNTVEHERHLRSIVFCEWQELVEGCHHQHAREHRTSVALHIAEDFHRFSDEALLLRVYSHWNKHVEHARHERMQVEHEKQLAASGERYLIMQQSETAHLEKEAEMQQMLEKEQQQVEHVAKELELARHAASYRSMIIHRKVMKDFRYIQLENIRNAFQTWHFIILHEVKTRTINEMKIYHCEEGQRQLLRRMIMVDTYLVRETLKHWSRVNALRRCCRRLALQLDGVIRTRIRDWLRSLIGLWSLLVRSQTEVAARSITEHRARVAANGALERLCINTDRLWLSCLFSQVVASSRRHRKSVCAVRVLDCWRDRETRAILKAVFCVWVDVLIVVQTAALRLGIRQTSVAFAECKDGMQKTFLQRERKHRVELQKSLVSAVRAVSLVTPIGARPMLALSCFVSWRCYLTRKRATRAVGITLARHIDSSLDDIAVTHCWAQWHQVVSDGSLERCQRRAHRCRHDFVSVLKKMVYFADLECLERSWQIWSELRCARVDRESKARRSRLLPELVCLLWMQDRSFGFVSFVFASWTSLSSRAALEANYVRAASHAISQRSTVDRIHQVHSRDVHRFIRRLIVDKKCALVRQCLQDWRAETQNSADRVDQMHVREVFVRRRAQGVVHDSICNAAHVHMWLFFKIWNARVAQGKSLHAEEFHRQQCRTHNRQALAKLTSRRPLGWSPCLQTHGFQCWIAFYASRSSQRTKHDLTMMVKLLEQSTSTCKGLRVELLVARRPAIHRRKYFIDLWALFHAWQGSIAVTLQKPPALIHAKARSISSERNASGEPKATSDTFAAKLERKLSNDAFAAPLELSSPLAARAMERYGFRPSATLTKRPVSLRRATSPSVLVDTTTLQHTASVARSPVRRASSPRIVADTAGQGALNGSSQTASLAALQSKQDAFNNYTSHILDPVSFQRAAERRASLDPTALQRTQGALDNWIAEKVSSVALMPRA